MQIDCKNCNSHFILKNDKFSVPIQFCPSCGHLLNATKKEETPFGKKETLIENQTAALSDITLVQGHAPETNIEFSIGPYQILKSIGKGGMGEVFLAYDTTCGRRIALKRIRADLVQHSQMHHRFLKEARVTSQLTHPAIIPIYVIHEESKLTYYTMPFVEGDTLKAILKDSFTREKKGEKPHPLGGSIPPLARIFLTICQAVAYAHSKGVLHRDLKPENIIVGKYGEVLILDWGLAKLMRKDVSEDEQYPEIKTSLHKLTHLGKVVGTISYMAPERAIGMPANIQTDIYSLGVILYQILTLRSPFKRGSLKEFRQNMDKEELYNPIEVAPYREVPQILSTVVLKCLSNDLEYRYKNVDELIHDIENYLEGRSEWFPVAELKIERKSDWEFQENVLIAEHIAITRGAEVTDWVSLMISKQSFPENIKIETKVQVKDKCHGLGILLSVPEKAEREHLNDGYCLWLGTDATRATKLLSSTIEVLHAPDTFLERNRWHNIRIEKIENNIHFYLDSALQFSYISHNPLAGTHIGLISRDANFAISSLQCFSGSESIQISCLAVPDAFLAHKDFTAALSEYRRIGYSFPGTTEGREAMFRAGITLLEIGKIKDDSVEQNQYFELALQEFGLLHGTPGAPLEYLGKALVYEICQDYEEEIKCFELGLRRYPKHPLLPVIHEQVVYRMYESSRANRLATYNFVLLSLRFLPLTTSNLNSRKLLLSLKKNWELLDFLEEDVEENTRREIKNASLECILSFWLAKPYVLIETLESLVQIKSKQVHGKITIMNILFSVINLGSYSLALKTINQLEKKISVSYDFELLKLAIDSEKECLKIIFEKSFKIFPKILTKKENRLLVFLLNKTLFLENTDLIHTVYEKLKDYNLEDADKLKIDYFMIASLLINKDLSSANEMLQSYPLELLNQETTPLHFLYGCWLYMTEGKEIAKIHFSGALEVSFPRTWSLGTHYLNGQLTEDSYWFKRAFMWEKRALYRQLILFYRIRGDEARVAHFKQLEKKQYVSMD
jgi:serine/threonine-protein kinase